MARNQLVECIPNISEGNDLGLINEIAGIIRNVDGVSFLGMDSGNAVNRTVFTFMGAPGAVIEAAYRLYQYTSAKMVMWKHKGVHPRLGSVDVCPFVPVKNIFIHELNNMVWELGKRIATDFNIPVFFYEFSALYPARKKLENIRKGGFEILPDKFYTTHLLPDIGPLEFNYKTGGTVMGVRGFLIAFNITLENVPLDVIKKMASELRKIRDNPQKNSEYVNKICGERHFGCDLKHFKVIGWELADEKRVQLSFNITNHRLTPLFLIYKMVLVLSKKYGASVGESELIGLIPKSALVDVSRFLQLEYENDDDLVDQVFSYLKISGERQTRVIDDTK